MTDDPFGEGERNNWWAVERVQLLPPMRDVDYLQTSGTTGGRVVTGVTICNDGTDEVVDIIVQ